MNSLFKAVVVAAIFAAPAVSFAQSNQTGASGNPENVQAMQDGTTTQDGAAQANTSGYGPNTNGAWQAGYRAETTASSYSPPVYYIGR
jgi:hypothetical protein